MEKPLRNGKRDAVVGVGIVLVLAAVVTVSSHEQERPTRVPDLSGIAVYQSPTVLEVRGLALGTVSVRDCPRLKLPATVLGQEPEAGTFVALGSTVNVTTCAKPN